MLVYYLIGVNAFVEPIQYAKILKVIGPMRITTSVNGTKMRERMFMLHKVFSCTNNVINIDDALNVNEMLTIMEHQTYGRIHDMCLERVLWSRDAIALLSLSFSLPSSIYSLNEKLLFYLENQSPSIIRTPRLPESLTRQEEFSFRNGTILLYFVLLFSANKSTDLLDITFARSSRNIIIVNKNHLHRFLCLSTGHMTNVHPSSFSVHAIVSDWRALT